MRQIGGDNPTITINCFTLHLLNEAQIMTPDTSDINLALQLLLIGMVSVFVILGIVVGLGKLLVTLVNKFSPEVVKPQKISKKKTVFNPKKNLLILLYFHYVQYYMLQSNSGEAQHSKYFLYQDLYTLLSSN